MFGKINTLIMAITSSFLLSGCAVNNPKIWETAKLPKATPATNKLNALPPTAQKVAVAVYGFTDQTGQFKPSDSGQTLSRAVTQGATSILVKSLHEAGNRNWFTVIEREKLDNVLRERAVIREMRASYLGEKTINPQALPPLLFAGVLLEGGIIGFDSNTKTGGSGARFLGIGGSTQYREDTVTVYLRAVSVKTGEVLTSVSTRKSIASVGVGGDAFRFVAFRELLELEAGITYNEPDELALRQTIEAAVYAMIMEGAMQDLWCFSASQEQVDALLTDYIAERDSVKKSKVALPMAVNGAPVPGMCGGQKAARSGGGQPQQISSANRIQETPALQAPAQNIRNIQPQAANPESKMPGETVSRALQEAAQLPVAASNSAETKPKAITHSSDTHSDKIVVSAAPASSSVINGVDPAVTRPNGSADGFANNVSQVAMADNAAITPPRIVTETMISEGPLPKGYTPSAPLRSADVVAAPEALPIIPTASSADIKAGGLSLLNDFSWSRVAFPDRYNQGATNNDQRGTKNHVQSTAV